MFTIVLSLVLFVYLATIAQLIYGFNKVPDFQLPTTHNPQPITNFAIVVPFRNESKNLPQLLESIKNLNYPLDLFEIILIDDFSEDDSVKQVYNWRMENGAIQTTLLENLRISNSPKKDAISRAIPIIKNEWILTTDADCIVPKNWLLLLDHYIQTNQVSMLVGAVTYKCKKSFLHHFQQLDLTSLQGATIGSFGMKLGFMCNGANLCYTKSLFIELNGFMGNNQMASGDDVFLLQKAMQSQSFGTEQVKYLKSKSNIVTTKPLDSWKALFQQRMRWASKTSSYKSVFGKDLAVIVFFGNLSIVVGCGLWVVGLLPWQNLLVLFLLKFSVDYTLLYKTNRFLTSKRMRFLIVSSLFYPFFCLSVALFSLFGKYEWKGRKF